MGIRIQDLMVSSGVKFGTSGARGLAVDMTDMVCYVYMRGFLQYLESVGELKGDGGGVAIAGDLRASTGRIMGAIRRAVADMGYAAINCGRVPSPAVAYYGIVKNMPAIMVTGSHIPADRNGIKFNKSAGEILKADEAQIREQVVDLDEGIFDEAGGFTCGVDEEWVVSDEARAMYVRRYLDVLPNDCLAGKHIGVYQHSAVGRDIIMEIVKGLGADAVALGRTDEFIPVDTEAIRREDVELAAKWTAEGAYDAIISTDGDSDRPLISDENGEWFRGDVAGILCAKYLGADSVSLPVSCNTAVEKCGWFESVSRTKIGSPYVIASMNEASKTGAKTVVGYEANGGFLTNTDIALHGKTLPALPTRDAVILLLSIILLAEKEGKKISQLGADLPGRFTASDRFKDFPQADSRSILEMFSGGDEAGDRAKAAEVFGGLCGGCVGIDRTDGVRMTFANDEIVHLRPSGNAPEFRCYNEASEAGRAVELNVRCMEILTGLRESIY